MKAPNTYGGITMWKTERLPIDENINIWIKGKKASAERYQIVIEVKGKEAILIHYPLDVYIVDIDRKDR